MRHVFAALLSFALGASWAFAMSEGREGNRQANRLIDAPSPYLRQHAYNPIDWFEWGEEAFEKARRENKPVFLSVGYSTCHWCHVMERESFENTVIADILNARFVAIKVDRERRPDVDETYMLATQLITGGGGWPNSVFLTPDRKPFYAGTYYPPDQFKEILSQVAGYWLRERDTLLSDAERMADAINTIMTRRVEARDITPEVMKTMSESVLKEFDADYGGFGPAPKFPQESVLLFLLRLAEKDGNEDALKAVSKTLHAILNGGITDHVGGGFHRYAVDRKWVVPHFEKMLYNQALLTLALVRAHRLTGDRRFASGARRTLDYVLEDLTGPNGGFYSARDADSEGEEGTFYVWTEEQIDKALNSEDATFAKKAFGVTFEGNFENGTTVLNFSRMPERIAQDMGLSEKEFDARIAGIARQLAKVRSAREAPHRDEKILTAWNGMMIAAFAEAAGVLGDPKYKDAALAAAGFIWEHMQKDGKISRTWFEGKVSLDGSQEDYAFLANGFIALFDLTGDRAWLQRAETLVATMVEAFRDEQAGDYYMTASAGTFSRAKVRTDAGTPSGNAAALEAFAKLSRRTTTPDHRINAEALLAALSGLVASSPASNAYFLMAGDTFIRGDAGDRRFLARGVVDARVSIDRTGEKLSVALRIADGWHINSSKPLEDFFIPTALAIDGHDDASISYPSHRLAKLGFHDSDVAVYDNEVEVRAVLPGKPGSHVVAQLTIQACSDTICLEPETAEFRIPLRPGSPN